MQLDGETQMSSRNSVLSSQYLALGGLLALVTITALAHASHPEGLSSKWLNKNVSELVVAYGEPDFILETAVRGIRVYGDTPSVMYVYTLNPEYAGGCIAAYVVELQTMKILRYQCR
jgi:hypothetical protein